MKPGSRQYLTLKSIRGLERDKAEETLHLDFKLANGPELTSGDDQRNLARAISGFANSEGGTVVWGVDARRSKDDGVDCVVALKPIPRVKLFVSRLKELSPAAVSPIVAGVEHKAIPLPDGSGFAVTFVPESDSGPHMAKLGGDDRYYKRNGGSFLRMEHFDVADMFGRRAKPSLELTRRLDFHRGRRIILGIKNGGRSIARAPYLALRNRHGPYSFDPYGLDGNNRDGMDRVLIPHERYEVVYRMAMDFVIHPGITLDVVAFKNSSTTARPDKSMEVEYALCADGFPLTEGVLVVPLPELE